MTKNAAFLRGRAACIFCEGFGHRSYEHVWSKWLHTYLPASHTRRHIRDGKRRPGDLSSVRLRVVCETCNNGWMSKLEETAKPILVPLVRGQPTILGKRNQEILARWIAMKVMVVEFSKPAEAISLQIERASIMSGGAPPPNWQIWIGRHMSRRWLVRFKGTNATLLAIREGTVPLPPETPAPKNVQCVNFGVGYLFVSVLFSTLPGLKFEPKQGITNNLFRLWPYRAGTFWPATPILNTIDAERIAAGFESFLGSLPETP